MKNLNKTAFSLLEVLLAAVIFVITIAGVFATLTAVRAPVTTKENGLTAAVFGKQVLETLRTQINANTFYGICAGTCTTFDLKLGNHLVTMPPATQPQLIWPSTDLSLNNLTGLSYAVTCADGSAAGACKADVARKIVLNINW